MRQCINRIRTWIDRDTRYRGLKWFVVLWVGGMFVAALLSCIAKLGIYGLRQL